MIVNVHTSATQGVARTHYEKPVAGGTEEGLGFARNKPRLSSFSAT